VFGPRVRIAYKELVTWEGLGQAQASNWSQGQRHSSWSFEWYLAQCIIGEGSLITITVLISQINQSRNINKPD
jgi:hypothetical protein